MPALLRRAESDDLPALGHVAYQTGFFGESAAQYFPDKRLFALLWVWPYLHGAGHAGCLTAQDSRTGEVLGYVLGSASPAAYSRALAHAAALGLLATLGGEVHRPAACWRYLLRLARTPLPQANKKLYPAHLHLNLLETSRGQGLGRRLLAAHLTALQAAGVPGVHLSTTAENEAALHLYHRCGFEVLHTAESDFWQPWLARPTTHIVMGRRL